MTGDVEFEVMREIAAALDKLDGRAARARVLRWAVDSYDVNWKLLPENSP